MAHSALASHPSVAGASARIERRRTGFVLYVAVDGPVDELEEPGDVPGPDELRRVAETLGELAREWLPRARTRSVLSPGSGEPTSDTPSGHPRGAAATPEPGAASPTPGSPPHPATSFRELLDGLSLTPQVHIDVTAEQVTVDGVPRRLTRQEFDLLVHLARLDGAVASREELHDTVWRGRQVPPGSRTVDVHVRRLREKLGITSLITTVHRAGYRIDPRSRVRLTA